MTELTTPESPQASRWPFSAQQLLLLPIAAFVIAILLSYGYEIFSFNLTIDEEVTAAVGRLTRAGWSLAEGRWAMAGLTLLLPSPVAPVVSTALGVGLSAIAWWLLSRHFLGLSAPQAAVAAALAGTMPVLAFLFSFQTIAFAIGVGNLLLVVFAVGLSSPLWSRRIVALVAAAAAIGIYDSFLVAIATLALAVVLRSPRVSTVLIGVGATVAAFMLSRVIGILASSIGGVSQNSYTSSFFDIAGFFATPGARLRSAIADVAGTFFVTSDRFGLSSPWLGVAFSVLLIAALVAVATDTGTVSERVIRGVALLGVVAAPFVIEAFASVVVYRSMVYLPITLLVVSAAAFGAAGRVPQRRRRVMYAIVTVLAVLAVTGNASVTNRLYATAATTYALDRDLAFDIGQEKDALLGGDQFAEIPLAVNGGHSWAPGKFTEVHETFGLSFFEYGDRRVAAFLNAHGVNVVESTEAEKKRAKREFASMPVYPYDGWVAVRDGILLLNFGAD